jgi:hypothetical protein
MKQKTYMLKCRIGDKIIDLPTTGQNREEAIDHITGAVMGVEVLECEEVDE